MKPRPSIPTLLEDIQHLLSDSGYKIEPAERLKAAIQELADYRGETELKWRPIEPKFGTLLTIEEFSEHRNCGAISPYDGSGRWATATHQSNREPFKDARPEEATHVIWYNK